MAGELADELMLRHHSVVGLIDRAQAGGLVERRADDTDQRVVRVALTNLGRRRLGDLASLHLTELGRLRGQIEAMELPADVPCGDGSTTSDPVARDDDCQLTEPDSTRP